VPAAAYRRQHAKVLTQATRNAGKERLTTPDEYDLDVMDGDGEEPSAAALAELQAIAEAETHTAVEADLEATRRELEEQRRLASMAVARYRDAALAAEPELPPDLVTGETLEEVDASLAAACRAVAQIRERLATESEDAGSFARGFPTGAPARLGTSTEGMSAAEKIARGLEERTR
jgi:hypothetical protein